MISHEFSITSSQGAEWRFGWLCCACCWRGFTVNAYAIGLGQARVMVLTSKGDIIVSSPPHRVLLVKADSEGDGRSDGVENLIEKLENPSGLFLDGDQLYIAEDSRVLRVGFDVETGKIAGAPEAILPTCRARACIGRARSRKARTATYM